MLPIQQQNHLLSYFWLIPGCPVKISTLKYKYLSSSAPNAELLFPYNIHYHLKPYKFQLEIVREGYKSHKEEALLGEVIWRKKEEKKEEKDMESIFLSTKEEK